MSESMSDDRQVSIEDIPYYADQAAREEIDRQRSAHEAPASEPMTDARLAEIRDLWLDEDAYYAVRELLAEVDRQADEIANLRLNLEGWQRTAGELTELLRQHVMHYGACVGPIEEPCICSHARAVAFLQRGGDRHDLEDVIAELGITEEEIAAADDGQDEEPDVIEITDDDLLTILRRPLARADDDDWPTVTVDTMALRLALDAWDRAKQERDDIDRGAIAEGATQRATIWRLTSENEQLWAERARLREVHTGIRRLITAWETRPGTFDTPSAATVLRDILGGEDVAFADEPAELTADHTLRTAAGQEASDE